MLKFLKKWWPQIWPDLFWRWQRRCLHEDGLLLRRLLPQICHHPHLKDERQTQEEGERDRNKWLASTTMMEERGEEITESSSVGIHPHLSWALHIQSALADVHRQTPEGRRSARGHGVPRQGKALLNPSTHTYTCTFPILIPHAPLTSLLKHRSKSPDWSQQLRNKWCQMPDFSMAFFCRAANLFWYWKFASQRSKCLDFTGVRWHYNWRKS